MYAKHARSLSIGTDDFVYGSSALSKSFNVPSVGSADNIVDNMPFKLSIIISSVVSSSALTLKKTRVLFKIDWNSSALSFGGKFLCKLKPRFQKLLTLMLK